MGGREDSVKALKTSELSSAPCWRRLSSMMGSGALYPSVACSGVLAPPLIRLCALAPSLLQVRALPVLVLCGAATPLWLRLLRSFLFWCCAALVFAFAAAVCSRSVRSFLQGPIGGGGGHVTIQHPSQANFIHVAI